MGRGFKSLYIHCVLLDFEKVLKFKIDLLDNKRRDLVSGVIELKTAGAIYADMVE